MSYSYIDDFTKNTFKHQQKKHLIKNFIDDGNNGNFDKKNNRYTDNSKKKKGGEWCSNDKQCESKRCDTGNKYGCKNKCMNSNDNKTGGFESCFSINNKNSGYNNYFVETEIDCANHSGKQNVYIDNDGFNKYYPKHNPSPFTPAMHMITAIRNNHNDDSYDYDSWIGPHKKAKIYYYTKHNDLIDETIILERKSNTKYVVQKFGPITLRPFRENEYQADYDFGNELDIQIRIYDTKSFNKAFKGEMDSNNRVEMTIKNNTAWNISIKMDDYGRHNRKREQTIVVDHINKNGTVFSITIKELYYIDSLYASRHNKGIYRNLFQNYDRDNSDMDGRLDDTSDITTTGKNTCGYVKAPVHSQALCEEKLVGKSQIKDIENKYKKICENRDKNLGNIENFSNNKPALHLQVLAFNFLVLGLVYAYINR